MNRSIRFAAVLMLGLGTVFPAGARAEINELGLSIATQGDAALRLIRQELLAALRAQRPELPRPAPAADRLRLAAGGGSAAAGVRSAE